MRRVPIHLMLATAALVGASSGCEGCDGKDEGDAASASEPFPARKVPAEELEKLDARDAGPQLLVLPEANIVERSGEVNVEQAPETAKIPGVEAVPDALFVGDEVETGSDGEATIDLGQGTTMVLGADSRISIGVHRKLEVVLHRGKVSLSGEAIRGLTRRFMIMTPAGVVFYAGPGMDVAVAADGSVRVNVTDCPLKEPPPQSLTGKMGAHVEGERCHVMVGDEQEALETGHWVVVDPALAVERGTVGEGEAMPDLDAWLAQRAEAFATDPAPAVEPFAGWVGPALEEIAAGMEDIEKRRASNKELIKKLRDLRKAGKPDASEQASGGKKAGPGTSPGTPAPPESEIAAVKEELTENSAEQYRLRHLIFARWYQVSLKLEILAPVLGDEALAPGGQSLAELEASVGETGAALLELFERKPRRKIPGKLPTSRFKQHPIKLPESKKPVAK